MATDGLPKDQEIIWKGRPAHYFEMIADDSIPSDSAPNVPGYTEEEWLALNKDLSDAFIDDEHKKTPVGEVVSTHLTMSEAGPKKRMLGAAGIIYRDQPRCKELSDAVATKKISTVSINYKAMQDGLTGRLFEKKFLGIGIHANPKKSTCTIYRRQGAKESEADKVKMSLAGSVARNWATPDQAAQSAITGTKASVSWGV